LSSLQDWVVLFFFVVRKFGVVGLVITALLTSALGKNPSVCPVSSPPIGKACKAACCANKSCCAESQKNHGLPSQPFAKNLGSNHELIATLASGLTTTFSSVQLAEVPSHFPAVQSVRSAPRLALLCTFLI